VILRHATVIVLETSQTCYSYSVMETSQTCYSYSVGDISDML